MKNNWIWIIIAIVLNICILAGLATVFMQAKPLHVSNKNIKIKPSNIDAPHSSDSRKNIIAP